VQEAPATVFAAGEGLEFGASSPERAIPEYQALLKHPEARVRAGALVRMARSQRKLGRASEALRTYEQLAILGAAPAGGATAELVALRETRQRERLKAALELGRYPLDRTTFAFYAEGLAVSRSARAWAEAAEQLWKRSRDSARGAEVLSVGGRSNHQHDKSIKPAEFLSRVRLKLNPPSQARAPVPPAGFRAEGRASGSPTMQVWHIQS